MVRFMVLGLICCFMMYLYFSHKKLLVGCHTDVTGVTAHALPMAFRRKHFQQSQT